MEHMDLVMMSGQEAKLNMRNPFDSKEVSMKACSATSKKAISLLVMCNFVCEYT